MAAAKDCFDRVVAATTWKWNGGLRLFFLDGGLEKLFRVEQRHLYRMPYPDVMTGNPSSMTARL